MTFLPKERETGSRNTNHRRWDKNTSFLPPFPVKLPAGRKKVSRPQQTIIFAKTCIKFKKIKK
jgi:hypothetical protein